MTNTILIEDIEYTNATFLKQEYNISSDRLTKWRNGRGEAKNNPLRYIKLQGSHGYLYSLDDVEVLLILTNRYKYNYNLIIRQ